jgi:hypothetical protein
MRSCLAVLLLALLGGACADTGGNDLTVPLYVAGTDVSEPFTATGEVPVALERADLAFGPLYLCAGARAGRLCETARLEWLGSGLIPATSPDVQLVGSLTGVSGPVRSFMYDLGITSLLTTTDPLVLPAAEELGGASLVVEGSADVDGIALRFRADIRVAQESETEIGVPVVLGSTSEIFGHHVTDQEPGLLVEFDPRAWVRTVDFRALAQSVPCATSSTAAPCEIGPETQAFRALHNAVVSGERPRFEWGFSP